MSESHYAAEALEQLFTSTTHGWFSPFVTTTDGLTAEQAGTDASELRPRPSVEATACGILAVIENLFMRSET